MIQHSETFYGFKLSVMYLVVRDIRFPVKKVSLTAGAAGNRIGWALGIEMGERQGLEDLVIDDEDEEPPLIGCEPRFTIEGIPFNAARWIELKGQSIRLEAPFSDDFGPRAMCYFWCHTQIPHVNIYILKRNANEFLMRLEGECDIHSGEQFDTAVPFVIEALVPFEGVYMNGRKDESEAAMRERLARLININDFNLIPKPTSMQGVVIFEPKPPVF